jgi:hypothetical protein
MTTDRPTTIGDKSRQGSLEKRSITSFDRIPDTGIFIKRTAIEFLQILFSTRDKDSFKYDPDDTVSDIQIQDAYSADLKSMSSQPSIIAMRGPVSWMGQGLGGNSIQSRQMHTGDHMFNDMLMGSLTFNCMARTDAECEIIAEIVMKSFRFFRPMLQKYGFFSIKGVTMGNTSLIDAFGIEAKLFACPVMVSVSVQEQYSVTDVAPRELREIVIQGIQGS